MLKGGCAVAKAAGIEWNNEALITMFNKGLSGDAKKESRWHQQQTNTSLTQTQLVNWLTF